jgi:hypothetical protein
MSSGVRSSRPTVSPILRAMRSISLGMAPIGSTWSGPSRTGRYGWKSIHRATALVASPATTPMAIGATHSSQVRPRKVMGRRGPGFGIRGS